MNEALILKILLDLHYKTLASVYISLTLLLLFYILNHFLKLQLYHSPHCFNYVKAFLIQKLIILLILEQTEQYGLHCYPRAQQWQISLSRWPSIEMVDCSWFLNQVARHMVKVSIFFSFFQDSSGLILKESHLFSYDLELIAHIGMNKFVSL